VEAGFTQIEVIDKRIDEPHRAVRRHIILDQRRQQQRLVARMTFDICHGKQHTPAGDPMESPSDFPHSLRSKSRKANTFPKTQLSAAKRESQDALPCRQPLYRVRSDCIGASPKAVVVSSSLSRSPYA